LKSELEVLILMLGLMCTSAISKRFELLASLTALPMMKEISQYAADAADRSSLAQDISDGIRSTYILVGNPSSTTAAGCREKRAQLLVSKSPVPFVGLEVLCPGDKYLCHVPAEHLWCMDTVIILGSSRQGGGV
jgi:hypothetical protein